MVGQGLVDGMPSNEIRAVTISGNIVLDGSAMIQQSGTYSTDGAPNPIVFATTYSSAPVVVLSPTESHGIGDPFPLNIVGSAFDASGAAAHTGNYIAWGSR